MVFLLRHGHYQQYVNAAPQITQLALADDPDQTGSDPHSPDPTLTGQVTDDGPVEGLLVQFDHDGDDVPEGTALADDSGGFSYSPSGLEPGSVTVRARAKKYDPDGVAVYSTWYAFQFTLDPPEPTSFQIYELALANNTGNSATDGATADPTVTGTVVGPRLQSVSVELDYDGDRLADAVVLTGAAGTFTITPEGLEEGFVTVRARAVEDNGVWPETSPCASLSLVYSSDPDGQEAQGLVATHATYLRDMQAAEDTPWTAFQLDRANSALSYATDMGTTYTTYITTVADALAQYEIDLATAQRDFTVAAAAAAATGDVDLASAYVTLVMTTAPAEKTYLDDVTALQRDLAVSEATASRDFQTAVATDYLNNVTTRAASLNNGWSTYQVALAEADKDLVAAMGQAAVDVVTATGNAQVAWTSSTTAEMVVYANAEANAHLQRITGLAGPRNTRAAGVAGAQLTYSTDTAQATATHDKNVVAANQTYADSVASEDATLQNAIDLAYGTYRRTVIGAQYELSTEPIGQAQYDATAQQALDLQKQSVANAERYRANAVAAAEETKIATTGSLYVAWTGDLATAANTLAGAIKSHTNTFATTKAGLDKTAVFTIAGAAAVLGTKAALYDRTYANDLAAAAAGLNSDLTTATNAYRADTAGAEADYPLARYTEHRDQMLAAYTADPSDLNNFRLAAATYDTRQAAADSTRAAS